MLIASTRISKAEDSRAPEDLSEWGLHCFCISAVHTPHGIIRLDTNGRILYQARTGTTQERLRKQGIATSESQIALLRTYGLLRQEGDVIKTSFPTLGPVEIGPLRERLTQLAAGIVTKITPDVRGITEQLRKEGLEANGYAVVFGYALDGLLWDELKARDALPSTDLNLAYPFWRGAFWAIYPERKDAAGTNEISEGNAALVTTWTDHVSKQLKAIADPDAIRPFLRAVGEGVHYAGPIDTNGASWELANANGKLLVPVIHQHAGDPIYESGKRIASAVAQALHDDPAGKAILASVKGATEQEAILIAAHELIWDVIDGVVTAGVVDLPGALGDAPVTPLSLRALVFIRVKEDR